jgi:hypothetical protein
MGYFLYADNRQIKLDDRALVHLQIVIIDKLRRGESFSLTLVSENRLVMMWLNAATPLQFIFEGNRRPRVNLAWVELMAGEASLTGNLELYAEPPRLEEPQAVGASSLASR